MLLVCMCPIKSMPEMSTTTALNEPLLYVCYVNYGRKNKHISIETTSYTRTRNHNIITFMVVGFITGLY